MKELLTNGIVKGAVSGVLAAAVVDVHAFQRFKNKQEFASYDWGTAGLRWFQGAITGALTAAGLGAFG